MCPEKECFYFRTGALLKASFILIFLTTDFLRFNVLNELMNEINEYFLKFLSLFASTILPVNNGKKIHSNGCPDWSCSSLHDQSNF